MTDAPIQIRKPEVVRKIRELALATGRPITDSVADAVDRELRRVRAEWMEEEAGRARRRERAMQATVARFQALPRIGPPLTDEDLYDEDGLPR
ncbi:MAG TPA: type II toxin-antitoxin system VapB family antitoxin [Caulobacteraceae bacterium]|nr:type II toxin-antitoxin system VapB family antitoxin [Caulobacteraceae bacterium]